MTGYAAAPVPARLPPALRPGDRLAAVTLSWGGAAAYPHRYEAGVRQFRAAFGVEIVPTRHALRDADWIARNPQARADDLMEAFADSAIQGIVSIIGGDDSIRILPHLDLSIIGANPKLFMGYSDATVTHLACWRAGLRTVHGPAVMTGFAENGGMHPAVVAALRRMLFEGVPYGTVEPVGEWASDGPDWGQVAAQTQRRAFHPAPSPTALQGRGRVRGHLLGGCFEVLEFLKGTPWWPAPAAWDGAVLFLEMSEERPHRDAVVRGLRNYAAQGILARLAGIVLGRPRPMRGEALEAALADYEEALIQVVRHEEGMDSLPILSRLDVGHTEPNLPLPYGALAELDADANRLHILEPAVAPCRN